MMNVIRFAKDADEAEILRSVRESNELFERNLCKLSETLESEPTLRFLGLTGPTCSGKTTAARMLTERLEEKGHTVHVISVDDFFYEKSYLWSMVEPESGEQVDYDSEKTIDVGLFADCVESLQKGKPVQLPHFNFLSGLREPGVLLKPTKEDLFLFEGIQILYPRIDGILPDDGYQSIYIAPQSALEIGNDVFLPNDLRLLRRLVRDHLFRGASASFTLSLWKGVRENEERNIFPYIGKCKYHVDSTMSFEIGVLKPYLEHALSRVKKSDPNVDTAKNLLKRLQPISAISSEVIPEGTLYREFV